MVADCREEIDRSWKQGVVDLWIFIFILQLACAVQARAATLHF